TEKYVLREAMKGPLPRPPYEREQVAFMAAPAHSDPGEWAAMCRRASAPRGGAAIRDAGLVAERGARALLELHAGPGTTTATRVELDAIVNHLLSVQILHRHFVAADVPALARERARALGWS